MMLKTMFSAVLSTTALFAVAQMPAPDTLALAKGHLIIQPVTHATMVLTANNKTIYVDPTGGAAAFTGLKVPGLVLVTDIHGDHFDPKTLAAIAINNATLVVPKAVADKLPADLKPAKLVVLNNGEKADIDGIEVTAVPMYNLPEAADAFHTKGRGNGYVLSVGGKRIYISGDTEDIPEMRALKNIDVAFVCMNLPYTMDVNQAAPGVLAFKPKIVYPYHYKGQDVTVFKQLVNDADKAIDVRLKEWYPSGK